MRQLYIGACVALLLTAAATQEPDPDGIRQQPNDAVEPSSVTQDKGDVGKEPTVADMSNGKDGDDDVRVEDVEEDIPDAMDANADKKLWKYDKNGILILSRHNFDRAIDEHDHLFVVFHTPACSQCIQLNPHFVEAWKAIRQKNTDELSVQFAKVDATNETSLLIHYGITQFPTLTFFKNQREKMYDGGYRSSDIETWVLKRSGDPALPFYSVDMLETARSEHDVFVVGFFNQLDSVSAIIFTRIADSIHDYPFFFAANPTLFKNYNITNDTVVVFKKFDDGRTDFTADKDFVTDDLMEFLRLETFPLVSELNIDNVWRVTEEANHIKSHFLVFRNASELSSSKDIDKFLLPAARKYKGDILFLMIDMADRRMFHMEEFFGVVRELTPAMRIFRYEGPTFKFRPGSDDGSISEEQVMQFCDDFKTGRLKPFKLEQPLPDDWDVGPVKFLTAKNYMATTGDTNRDVFVMLHAPWCPHCQLVMPIFEMLADRYQSHSEAITFAKMDATANEIDGLEFASFPTFYLYGKDGAERQQFNGTRTLDDMTAFLNQYSSVRLELDGGAASTGQDKESAGSADPAAFGSRSQPPLEDVGAPSLEGRDEL